MYMSANPQLISKVEMLESVDIRVPFRENQYVILPLRGCYSTAPGFFQRKVFIASIAPPISRNPATNLLNS